MHIRWIYTYVYGPACAAAAFTGWETLGGGNSPGALRSKGRQEIDYVIIAPVCGRNTTRARVYYRYIKYYIRI